MPEAGRRTKKRIRMKGGGGLVTKGMRRRTRRRGGGGEVEKEEEEKKENAMQKRIVGITIAVVGIFASGAALTAMNIAG
ncbi:hypothetical protein PoB_005680600 [Plakobranchus ocellatus]|uniref:Uncharacterized protein n=1 Tax=Plakobranchus ocellatus TaxID=259542 RepID=A0AAV4CG08_9GAST|nr:hypothetical protein PoB_005680600 [Plakobranchus ocellatus]